MNDDTTDITNQEEGHDPVLERLERLEREHQEFRRDSERRIVLAETKAEAIRAGMIDLDGLRFLDLNAIQPDADGGLGGITEAVTRLKSSKPWLFGSPSSSSVARVPPSRPPRQKLATEMTNEEYRIARAKIIGRSTF